MPVVSTPHPPSRSSALSAAGRRHNLLSRTHLPARYPLHTCDVSCRGTPRRPRATRDPSAAEHPAVALRVDQARAAYLAVVGQPISSTSAAKRRLQVRPGRQTTGQVQSQTDLIRYYPVPGEGLNKKLLVSCWALLICSTLACIPRWQKQGHCTGSSACPGIRSPAASIRGRAT
jgi:hypothetical protein